MNTQDYFTWLVVYKMRNDSVHHDELKPEKYKVSESNLASRSELCWETTHFNQTFLPWFL